jgi:hypothetical protein
MTAPYIVLRIGMAKGFEILVERIFVQHARLIHLFYPPDISTGIRL